MALRSWRYLPRRFPPHVRAERAEGDNVAIRPDAALRRRAKFHQEVRLLLQRIGEADRLAVLELAERSNAFARIGVQFRRRTLRLRPRLGSSAGLWNDPSGRDATCANRERGPTAHA